MCKAVPHILPLSLPSSSLSSPSPPPSLPPPPPPPLPLLTSLVRSACFGSKLNHVGDTNAGARARKHSGTHPHILLHFLFRMSSGKATERVTQGDRVSNPWVRSILHVIMTLCGVQLISAMRGSGLVNSFIAQIMPHASSHVALPIGKRGVCMCVRAGELAQKAPALLH